MMMMMMMMMLMVTAMLFDCGFDGGANCGMTMQACLPAVGIVSLGVWVQDLRLQWLRLLHMGGPYVRDEELKDYGLRCAVSEGPR